MRIRKVNLNDSLDVFDWRNDPTTRAMFVNPELIEFGPHPKWLKDSIDNPNRLLLMVEVKKLKIGWIRFDIKGEIAETSINIKPSERGKKFASKVIAEGINYLCRHQKKIQELIVKIKPENIASKRSFSNAGFKYQSKENDLEVYSYFL